MHDIDTQVPSTLIVCALLAALAKPGLQISNHIEGPPMFFTQRGDCLERLQNNGHFAFHPSHWLPIGRPVFCRFSQYALEDNDHHSRGRVPVNIRVFLDKLDDLLTQPHIFNNNSFHSWLGNGYQFGRFWSPKITFHNCNNDDFD